VNFTLHVYFAPYILSVKGRDTIVTFVHILIKNAFTSREIAIQGHAFSFSFRLGWAVCAAQRLRPQYGSISHPQKIPSKYWVLKVRGRSSKKHYHPRSRILVADRIISLQSSDCSSPKKKGYC